ncbi:MAG TPA: peroxiredoxin [Microthrixaceae bacterium]|jgi:peroxiredoxin Q/BCP|nr:peroxiredoxin [Microthrixaceae bacterium]
MIDDETGPTTDAAVLPGPGDLRIGDPAPEFTLDGVDGRSGAPLTVSLASLQGRPLVIAFYPADDSPVCTAQLNEYTATIGEFDRLDAQVVAISPQSPESHRGFAAAQGGFAFPLLSDVDMSVGRSFGVVGLLDLYRRSTFVLDAQGAVRYAHRYLNAAAGYHSTPDLVSVLSGL